MMEEGQDEAQQTAFYADLLQENKIGKKEFEALFALSCLSVSVLLY